jgi:hypothetical protein
MPPEALEAARSRYTAAYEAYKQAYERVAATLASGLIPSSAAVDDEVQAIGRLAEARSELLAAMINLAPSRS